MVETTSTLPVANSVAVLREEFDDWAVLYNPDTGEAVSVNPVGVAVWKMLDGKHSVADIAAEIQGLFEDAPETILEDMGAFLQGLKDKGLVRYDGLGS